MTSTVPDRSLGLTHPVQVKLRALDLPLSPGLETTTLLSSFINLTISASSSERYYVVLVSPCLTYRPSHMSTRFTHLAANGRTCFF